MCIRDSRHTHPQAQRTVGAGAQGRSAPGRRREKCSQETGAAAALPQRGVTDDLPHTVPHTHAIAAYGAA
eukprot:280310-Prymnesium_polylepis.1